MKVSTEIGSASKIIGEERAIELVAKAGFDAWDFSMLAMCRYDRKTKSLLENPHPLASRDYLAFARRLKQVADDNGITCNQAHAPFPTSHPQIRTFMKRSLECAAEVGCEICVIHPDNYKSAEENAEFYHQLLPFAKECGVKIATENMWRWDGQKDQASFAACATPDDFCRHVDIVDDDYLVACLDLGHAEMRGIGTSAVEMIMALGHRLQALHIHDNDKWHDSHQLPFTMDIDFAPIAKALREIGYSGYFTLEADRYLDAYNEDNIFEGIKNMAEAATKFAEMFEESDG